MRKSWLIILSKLRIITKSINKKREVAKKKKNKTEIPNKTVVYFQLQ